MASSITSRSVSRCVSSYLKLKRTTNPNAKLYNALESKLPLTSLSSSSSAVRFFSDDNNKKGTSNDEDPFGVNYKDGDSDGNNEESAVNIGPKDDLPPNYIRDSATGKFTGKIQREVSREEANLLKLSPLAKERLLAKQFSETVGNEELETASRRIREQDIAFNTLGRKVADLNAATDDGVAADTAPLTDEELKSLGKFMKSGSNNNNETKSIQSLLRDAKVDNLIPIARKSSSGDSPSVATKDENNPDLDLEWTTLAAQQSMGGVDEEDLDDPFANLMPSDLNPAQKVNRKRAKPIPKELLHHNNLSLLRRYVTPGGQIMNRVQSRLGAKDQRKIAKLVKRARNLGLIPVIGQWKVEDHGNTKEQDILENRDWENELLDRGLIKAKSSVYGKGSSNTGGTPTSGMW